MENLHGGRSEPDGALEARLEQRAARPPGPAPRPGPPARLLHRGGVVHRPLWQIFLSLFLVAFIARRVAVAFLVRAEGLEPVLVAAYGLQVAAGLAVVAGLWFAKSWTVAAVLALGVLVGATSLLEGFFLGLMPPFAAVSQLLVAAVATGLLVLLLRYELGDSGSARG